jgi:hypothetical protein
MNIGCIMSAHSTASPAPDTETDAPAGVGAHAGSTRVPWAWARRAATRTGASRSGKSWFAAARPIPAKPDMSSYAVTAFNSTVPAS